MSTNKYFSHKDTLVTTEVFSKPIDIPIVSIAPTEVFFTIVWQINNLCNYHCMYCEVPDRHVDPANYDDSGEKTLEDFQRNWRSIIERSEHLGLKYKIAFTGGEPVLNKAFVPFIKWLRENYHNDIYEMGVTSNGSISVNSYKEMYDYLDWVCLSLHTEYAGIDKFLAKCDTLNQHMKGIVPDKRFHVKRTFHVNFMDEDWLSAGAKKYIADFFDTNGISYSTNAVVYEGRQHKAEPRMLKENKVIFNL